MLSLTFLTNNARLLLNSYFSNDTKLLKSTNTDRYTSDENLMHDNVHISAKSMNVTVSETTQPKVISSNDSRNDPLSHTQLESYKKLLSLKSLDSDNKAKLRHIMVNMSMANQAKKADYATSYAIQFVGNMFISDINEVSKSFSDILYNMGFIDENKIQKLDYNEILDNQDKLGEFKINKKKITSLKGILVVNFVSTNNYQITKENSETVLQKIIELIKSNENRIVTLFFGSKKQLDIVNEIYDIKDNLSLHKQATVITTEPSNVDIANKFEQTCKERGYYLSDTITQNSIIQNYIENYKILRNITENNDCTIHQFISAIIEAKNKAIADATEINELSNRNNFKIITDEDINKVVPKILDENFIVDEYLDDLIGLDLFKEDLKTLVKIILLRRRKEINGLEKPMSSRVILFQENSTAGNGVRTSILSKIFVKLGITKSLASYHTSYENFLMRSRSILEQDVIKDTILNIDLSNTKKSSNVEKKYQLISDVVDFIKNKNHNTTFIFSGNKDMLDELALIDENIKQYIMHTLKSDANTPTELAAINKKLFTKKGFEISDDTCKHIEDKLTKRNIFTNSHLKLENLLSKIIEKQNERLVKNKILSQDKDIKTIINSDIDNAFSAMHPELNITNFSYESIMANELKILNNRIGTEGLKQALFEIILERKFEKLFNLNRSENTPLFLVFTGNSGTGKTSSALLVTEILYQCGFIKNNRLITANRGDLIHSNSNGTARQTNKIIEKASGGVLYIDEAHALCPLERGMDIDKSHENGYQALNAIIAHTGNPNNDTTIILGGYTGQMRHLISQDQGLKERITREINFKDYDIKQLVNIFCEKAKKDNYTINSDAYMILEEKITKLKKHLGQNFSNARSVIKFYSFVKSTCNNRILANGMLDFDITKYKCITKSDIENTRVDGTVKLTPTQAEEAHRKILQVKKSPAWKELHKMIALEEIKDKLEKLYEATLLASHRLVFSPNSYIQQEKKVYNIILMGPPGTGKTTVASLLAQILTDMGLIPSSKFSHLKHNDLVSKYLNASANHMEKTVIERSPGVIFIDEAYSLLKAPEEVISNLMLMMEDASLEVTFIFAGYKKQMEQLIDTNPGLRSRVQFKFELKAFENSKLKKICEDILKEQGYALTDSAKEKLTIKIQELKTSEGENFGNARSMKNLCSSIIQVHNSRLCKLLHEKVYSNNFELDNFEFDNSEFDNSEFENMVIEAKDVEKVELPLIDKDFLGNMYT